MSLKYSDQIFQKNLQRYSSLYPSIGQQLAELTCQRVHFYHNSNGELNLSEVKNDKIHYFYSPESIDSEISTWIENQYINNISTFYLFGIGLGYYYKVLKSWVAENSKNHLVFLETDLEVLHRFLETDLATEILATEHVHILFLNPETLWSEQIDQFTTAHAFSQFTCSNLEYYAKELSQICHLVSSQINFGIDFKRKSFSESLLFGGPFFENYYRNLLKIPESYLGNGLFGKFKGVPAIICGAGPSLERSVPFLKQLKGKALIFAGGTALNALNAFDLQPHFGIGIDPNEAQKVRILSNTAYEVPFFYRQRFSFEALEQIHGDRLWLSGSSGYRVSNWFENQLGIQGDSIEEGNNVINMSLSLAHAMGCDPLICVGLDLAYTQGKSYSSGIVSHPIYEQKYDFTTKSTNEELLLRRDVHGQEIFTLAKWLHEAQWFAEFANKRPEISLVNATGGGIGFPGVLNVYLEDFINKLFPNTYDFESWIHTEIQNNTIPKDVSREKILLLIEEMRVSLAQCQFILKDLLVEQGELLLKLSKKEEIPSSLQTEKEVEKLKELEKEIAYEYILKDMDLVFGLIAQSQADLELNSLSENAEEQKTTIKIKTQVNRYHRMLQAATHNLSIMTKVIKENEEAPEEVLNSETTIPILPPSSPKNLQKKETFYSNEKKKSVQFLKEDLLEGNSLFFGKNGSLVAQSTYEKGIKEGQVVLYYSTGQVYARLNYKAGLLNGLQQYFFVDGVTKTLMNYSEGLLDGKVELYFPNGQIQRESYFLQGKHHGQDKMWNQEGTLILEAEYQWNRPVNIARAWHSSKVLKKLIMYDAKSNKYEVHQWDKDGKLLPVEFSSHDDYFDKVTKLSGAVADSLKTVIEGVMHLMPLVMDTPEVEGDLMDLKSKMLQLEKMHREMKYDSGLHEDNPAEPLWKSESSRRMIEKEIENVTNSISKQVSFLQNVVFETRTKFHEK